MTSHSSPCIGTCTIDHRSGFCLGCHRSLDEIATWGSLTEPERLAVMAALPTRIGPTVSATPLPKGAAA